MVFEQSLEGKTLVVTGGSRGIGKEIVRQATNVGADVFFTYHENLSAAGDVENETGAIGMRMILGNSESTSQFLVRLGEGSVDYFIANAGEELSGGLPKHEWPKIARIVNANLIGNLYLLQGLITRKTMRHGGQIAVVGSIAADGNRDQLAYSASKAGLRGAVEYLSRYDSQVDEQDLGIKLIEPAFVRTEMAARALNVLERRIKRNGESRLTEFKERKYVMEVDYAAEEILGLTIDPIVNGVRTIPEGANLHQIIADYFN